jgi:hypothetical protein
MPDPKPKLRVIDEVTDEPAEMVRLGSRGVSVEPVERLPGRRAKEAPARLESEVRENFEGRRSLEPGMEAILDQQAQAENVEQPWGVRDGRLVGVPYGWFVLIALVLVAGGVWSVLSRRRGEIQLKIDHGAVRELVEKDEEEHQSATFLVEEVERVVKAYLEADSVDGLLPFVRHPERVRPMIEEVWAAEPRQPLKFVRMYSFEPATLEMRPFWVVRAEVEEGEPQIVILEQTAGNGVKVDWETHVCRQPVPWGSFATEKPVGEALDFRLWAVPDAHYSHEFSDAGRWRCYRLTAKGSDEHLFGYVLAGSEGAVELEGLVRGSPGAKATVMLRLRRPEGSASPRGAVIEKVVAPRWLLLDEASQDSP